MLIHRYYYTKTLQTEKRKQALLALRPRHRTTYRENKLSNQHRSQLTKNVVRGSVVIIIKLHVHSLGVVNLLQGWGITGGGGVVGGGGDRAGQRLHQFLQLLT